MLTLELSLSFLNINLRLNFILEKNSSLKLIDVLNDVSEKIFINTFCLFLILIYYFFDVTDAIIAHLTNTVLIVD